MGPKPRAAHILHPPQEVSYQHTYRGLNSQHDVCYVVFGTIDIGHQIQCQCCYLAYCHWQERRRKIIRIYTSWGWGIVNILLVWCYYWDGVGQGSHG